MQITAADIKPGQVVDTAHGRIEVTRVVIKWGAVQVTDSIRWYGLSATETVRVAGHFNPEQY